MKIVHSFVLLTGVAHAALDFSDWHPAPVGASRSPCPALNSMANHGFISRDGRNLTVPGVVQALQEVVNMSPEVATSFANGGLQLAGPGATTFNLDNLNLHNGIEHDASLSRQDYSVNNDSHTFSPEIFNEFLTSLNGVKNITIPDAAAARWSRVQTERKRDPKFTYSASNRFFSYGESAIYFSVLSDPSSQTVPVDWLKTFFTEERFPYTEGWRTPQRPLDGIALAQNILLLSLATPEDLALTSTNPRDLRVVHGVSR